MDEVEHVGRMKRNTCGEDLGTRGVDPGTNRQSGGGQKFCVAHQRKLILVANQDSDTLVAFRVDAETGDLTPTGKVTSCPTPVCVVSVDL